MRVFVLHGLGGVGKTALAQKFAERIRKEYDTHIYLDLLGMSASPLSPDDVMTQILREFDPNIPDGIAMEKLQDQYVSLVNRERILLLLDNARDDQQVVPLNKSNNSCLLVTSRESSFLMGAKIRKIEQMTSEDAKALLFSIAGEERFEGRGDELAHLAGYLPMALLPLAALLAKNYMEDAAELVQKYQTRKERLSLSNPSYRDNITVYASFDLSYETLSDELRRYWRQLAVFPGDFHNGGPAYVWNVETKEKLDDSLKRLCQHNLLNGNKDTERYRLHDLARDYLNEKIRENSDEELRHVNQRHSEYYALVIKTANSFIEAGRYHDALYYFDLERLNIVAGREWAKTFSDQNYFAAQLFLDYSRFSPEMIALRLHPRNAIEWHTATLHSARQLKNQEAEVSALRDLGLVYRSVGEYQYAISLYKQAVAASRQYNNSRMESEVLSNLGIVYSDLVRFRTAFAHQRRAMQIAEKIEDQPLKSKILGNIGQIYRRIDPYSAITYFEGALQIDQETKNQRDEGFHLGNLGRTYLDLEKLDKAIDLLERALQFAREMSDRESEGCFLGDLGVAYSRVGNRMNGIQALRNSIYILDAIDSPDAHSFRLELQNPSYVVSASSSGHSPLHVPIGYVVLLIAVWIIFGFIFFWRWVTA